MLLLQLPACHRQSDQGAPGENRRAANSQGGAVVTHDCFSFTAQACFIFTAQPCFIPVHMRVQVSLDLQISLATCIGHHRETSFSLCRKLAVPRKANTSVTAASITFTTLRIRCLSHWWDPTRPIPVSFPFQETGGRKYQFHACTSAMRSHGRQPSVHCADSSLGPLWLQITLIALSCATLEKGSESPRSIDHREARREETRVPGFTTKNRCLIFPTCGSKQKINTVIDELETNKKQRSAARGLQRRLCDKDVATRTSRTGRHGTKQSTHLSPLRGS